MPSPINRVPIGLTQMLDIKATGVGPRFLLDTVQPTFDLGQLYFIGQERGTSGTFAASLNAFSLGPQVPASQYWLVTDFSAYAQPGAGESIRLSLMVRGSLQNSAGATSQIATFVSLPGEAAASQTATVLANRSFIAQPASYLGFMTEELTGAVDVVVSCRYYAFSF